MTDLDRITHPLRLAKGTHQRGSGKGCAMNVISYINGDVEITDFPSCTARPLAKLVQRCNDLFAGPDGFLSPENSLIVLDLGWRAVGTADVDPSVVHNWLAELLDSDEWGVIRFAAPEHVSMIREIADLNRRLAGGEDVTANAAIAKAAYAAYAAYAANAAASAAIAKAAYAAYAAYAAADAANAAVDAAAHAANAAYNAAHAAYAAANANAAYNAANAAEFTGKAIECWRTLAGLDNTTPDTAAIDCALAQIAETHS